MRHALWVALVVATLGGCQAKPGASCSGGGACADESTQLGCVDGKYVAMPCRGPKGCVAVSGVVSCDIRANAAGEACVDVGDRAAYCSPDGKARVSCAAGKTVVAVCDGPGGCSPTSDKSARCDQIAHFNPGDACRADSQDVCADDHKTWLGCTNGKLAMVALCRGPTGCRPFAGSVACDTSVAEVGDLCAMGDTCSVDRKAVVSCQGGHMVKTRDCLGPKGCAGGSNGPVCDQGKAPGHGGP